MFQLWNNFRRDLLLRERFPGNEISFQPNISLNLETNEKSMGAKTRDWGEWLTVLNLNSSIDCVVGLRLSELNNDDAIDCFVIYAVCLNSIALFNDCFVGFRLSEVNNEDALTVLSSMLYYNSPIHGPLSKILK